MMPLTVDAMLAATGTSLRAQSGPADLRQILTAAVLACTPASALAKFLEGAGRPVPERTLIQWLKSTRAWLGLPPINRGRAGEEYRQVLDEWHRINGYPTAQEIENGWVPVHRRSEGGGSTAGVNAEAPEAPRAESSVPAPPSMVGSVVDPGHPESAVDDLPGSEPHRESAQPTLSMAEEMEELARKVRSGEVPKVKKDSRKPVQVYIQPPRSGHHQDDRPQRGEA